MECTWVEPVQQIGDSCRTGCFQYTDPADCRQHESEGCYYHKYEVYSDGWFDRCFHQELSIECTFRPVACHARFTYLPLCRLLWPPLFLWLRGHTFFFFLFSLQSFCLLRHCRA